MTQYEYSTTESGGAIGVIVPIAIVDALGSGRARVHIDCTQGGVSVGVFLHGETDFKRLSVSEAEEALLLPVTEEEKASSPPPSPVKEKQKEKRVSFVSDSSPGIVSSLSKMKISDPNEKTTLESERIAAEHLEQGKTSVEKISFERAKSIVESKRLDRHKTNGVLNFYPKKSLVKQDFKRLLLQDFQARVVYVAGVLSNAYAIRRIKTDVSLRISKARTLNDWWELADSQQRMLLLSDEKNRSACGHPLRLSLIPCPFQDAGLSEETSDSESA